MARRCTSLVFTNISSAVLVADKSGDVYRYAIADPDQDGQLILGHVSMLLDIVSTYIIDLIIQEPISALGGMLSEVVGICELSRLVVVGQNMLWFESLIHSVFKKRKF